MENDVDFALVQEPNIKTINSVLVADVSGGLVATFFQSPTTRAAIVHRQCTELVFLEHLSSPDRTVAQVRLGGFPCFLISAYFDGNRPIEEDLLELENVIRIAPGGRFLVHADVNARHEFWHDVVQNDRGRSLKTWLSCCGYAVHNRSGPPTFVRPDGTGHSWIDLTFSDWNTGELVLDWGVNLEIDSLSDHSIIDFQLSSRCSNCPSFSTRRFSQAPPSLSKLHQAVETVVVENFHSSPTDKVDSFNKTLLQLCESFLPPRRPPKQKRGLLWWDSEVRKARSTKNRLSKQLKHCESEQQCLTVKVQLKAAKDEYRRLLVTKGRFHWREFVKTVNLDRIYGLLRSLSRPRFSTQPVHDLDGAPLLSDDLAAEFLASSFFGDCRDRPASSTEQPLCNNSELCVTEDELRQVVFRFGKSKAPGPDGVTATIFRTLFEANPSSFVDCYSTCLRNGLFPEAWKTGAVVMLAKGRPGPLVAKSFRPITLLPIMGKALERLIADRIVECINSGIGFHPSQYGFRAGRSTVDALADLGRSLRRIRSAGQMAILISLDITGAFDSVSWSDVITSLQNLGVPSNLVQMCRSFFDNRCIELAYKSGRARRWLDRGCPQGSITGPLMWNVVFDSLLRLLDRHGRVSTFAYADDLLLVVEAGTVERLSAEANSVLETVCSWGQTKNLVFNPSKTQCLFWRKSSRVILSNPVVVMQDNELPLSNEILYLGVVLDETGSWKPHLERAKKKAATRLAVCARVAGKTWGLDFSIRQKLYKTVFLPTLLYAAPAWAPGLLKTEVGRRSLLSSQRPGLIWCTSAFRSTSNEALSLLADVLPLDLEAKTRVEKYWLRRKGKTQPIAQIHTRSLLDWKDRIEISRLNPVLRSLLRNGRIPPHIRCELDYWSTQLLTGHGSFGSYLKNIKARTSADCPRCGVRQDNIHILFHCRAVAEFKRGSFAALTQHQPIDWGGDLCVGRLFSEFAKISIKTLLQLTSGADSRCVVPAADRGC